MATSPAPETDGDTVMATTSSATSTELTDATTSATAATASDTGQASLSAASGGTSSATTETSLDSDKKPLYSINSKGFMQYSENLVVNERYRLRKPMDLDELDTTHGKGRYGSVYCVNDMREGGRIKALKILKLAEDGDDNFIRRELKVLRRITAGEMPLVSEYESAATADQSSTASSPAAAAVAAKSSKPDAAAASTSMDSRTLTPDATSPKTVSVMSQSDSDSAIGAAASKVAPIRSYRSSADSIPAEDALRTGMTESEMKKADERIRHRLSAAAAASSAAALTGGDSDLLLVKGCPFVIQLLDYGGYRAHAYFVFEYCQVTLQEHLQYIFTLNLPTKALQKASQSGIPLQIPGHLASAAAAAASSSAASGGGDISSAPLDELNASVVPALRIDMPDASLILSEYVNFCEKTVMMHPFDVWIIYWQLLQALSYIHTICKVMHLDFKPNNIMIRSYKCALIQGSGPDGDPDSDSKKKSAADLSSDELTLVKLIEPRIMLIDFSVSTRAPRYVDLDKHPCKGHYGTRRYRAPEMIYGGIWNRSIDTFGASLIILECINVVRILENKYRDEFGRKFKRRKHARGTKKYEKREIVDYLKRMAKTIMGMPSEHYVDSLLTEEWKRYFDDILDLPETDGKSPVFTVKRRVEDLHITAAAASAAASASKDGTTLEIATDSDIDMIRGGGSAAAAAGIASSASSGSSMSSGSSSSGSGGTGLLSSVFGHRRRSSGTIRIHRTLSEANQTAPFVRSREKLIHEYLTQYRRFFEAHMVTETDTKRLTVLEKVLNKVFYWEVAKRMTPEEALEVFFKFDKDYMLSCLGLDSAELKDFYQSREEMLKRKAREKAFAEKERRLKEEMEKAAAEAMAAEEDETMETMAASGTADSE